MCLSFNIHNQLTRKLVLVGDAGFEPTTSASRTLRATRLR